MDNQFNNSNNQNQNQNQNWFSAVNKKKALFIGGAALALLLIAGGAYYYFYYQKPSAPIFPNVENGTNPFNDIAAGKKPASVDCGKETNQMAKDACWQSQAVTEKNVDLCKSIATNNPFISKDGCFNLAAQATKDIKICGLIKTSAIKANCEKVVKGQSVF